MKYLLRVLALVFAVSEAGAQVTERPQAFDSAGRVRTISPALAARLGLTGADWPVDGPYVEVRLFSLSTGDYVLAVSRENGDINRYPITPEQRAALQSRIDEAMTRVGRPASEDNTSVVSANAGRAFMTWQMILAFTLYGGSLAVIVADETASPALYLMAPAATFFIAANYARKNPVSRAQNHLATDGAVRAALMANGLLYTLDVDDNDGKAYAAATFIGGLSGTIAGLRVGRGLTDGEAHGATWGSTSLAATTLGLLGAGGMFDDGDNGRVLVGTLIGTGLAGYPLGLRYVRKARYVVSAGDVRALAVASALGLMVAATPMFESDNPSEQAVFGMLTAGFVAGQVFGDRLMVKPFDYTPGEGFLLGIGAIAGGLMGGGVAILGQTDNATAAMGLVTAGAIGGVAVTHRFIDPARDGTLRTRRADNGTGRRPRVSLHPTGVAQTMAKVPGHASLLTITF